MQETALVTSRPRIDSVDSLRNGIWPRSIPLWMAAIYVALFIIRPWEVLFPTLGTIHFERIYFISFLLITFFSAKRQPVGLNSQSIAVILFLLAIGISGIFAYNPSLSWNPFYISSTLVLFYFLLTIVIRSPYDLVFMVTTYIVTMTAYLAKAQWEYFVHGQNRYDMGVIRMIGIENTYGGPNDLSMSIIVSLPMLIFLWAKRKEIVYGWPIFYQKWLPRILFLYGVLAISSIVLTNSRSGMVGFILFVALLAFYRSQGFIRKIGYVMVGVILLGLIWTVIPEQNKGRFRTIWGEGEGRETQWAIASAEGRIEGFHVGMKMFNEFPIAGVGIGNFMEYRKSHIDGIELQPHNLIGQVLGETGLLGLISFVFMVLITLFNFLRVKALTKSSDDIVMDLFHNFSIAGRDALILLFFLGLFGHNLTRFNWLWLAAFSVLSLQMVQERHNIMSRNNHE